MSLTTTTTTMQVKLEPYYRNDSNRQKLLNKLYDAAVAHDYTETDKNNEILALINNKVTPCGQYKFFTSYDAMKHKFHCFVTFGQKSDPLNVGTIPPKCRNKFVNTDTVSLFCSRASVNKYLFKPNTVRCLYIKKVNNHYDAYLEFACN